MKTATRKVYKKVGSTFRQMTEIKCDVCGARTFADGPKKIQNYLSRSCDVCDTLETAQRRGLAPKVFHREKQIELAKRSSDGLTSRRKTHGLSHLKLYKVWKNMFNRCYDDSAPNYEYYGGRGITVCDEWIDFTMFYWHMGEVPPGMEIDRIDNDYIYCPENCRWVPRSVQNQNRRKVFKRYKPRCNSQM